MKTKLFNGLKQAYSNLGLSDEIIQGHATALADAGFVTDENLATVLQGQEGVLKALQSTIDKRVTDAVGKIKPNPNPQPTPPPTGLTAEDVKKIVADTMQPYAQQINDMTTQSAAEKRNAEIMSVAKKHGVPDFMMRDRNVPAEANLDDYFKGVAQEVTDAGFALTTPPQNGGKPKDDGSAIASLINKGTEELNKK